MPKTIVYDYSGKAKLGDGFEVIDKSQEVAPVRRKDKPVKRPRPTQCEVCGKTGRMIHDRKGIMRGFLCNRCNLGLLYFDDDAKKLAAAIDYLKKWSKNEQPMQTV